MARATNLDKLQTMMVNGHVVFGFDDEGKLSTVQFLPDEEGVDLIPRCSVKKCSTFIRRDGTFDIILINKKQHRRI